MSEYFTFNEYMKNNKLTPSEEDYVEMIYRINLRNKNVQMKDVANELNIKPASVTKMVKKLNEKGILEYKKYDYIKLTPTGYKLGETLLKRHNTIYRFLQILGLEHNIHEETEKMEHTISYDTLEKMSTLIDFFSKYEDIYSSLRDFQRNKNLDT
ncbi:MAG: metal-dependent transcriptional regulator [Intestinibacter bartlettii]|uniref:metal-dependent transcriptional regulator n=1 Tax=Intestinibacter bartlettii TaxID=261299 RepID=UPI0026F2E318|nr:metal-dependent transcriptional regulator [Intestinibacter bartlettii]MDO5010056.1 metal-dependent transcriptional regulator [Intestinibacter bartlettii]